MGAMTEHRQLAIVRSYDELIIALRAHCTELGSAGETYDDVAGLPLRYTSKLLAPVPIKTLGRISLGPLLGVLGLALVVVEDAEALARIRDRLTPRQNSHAFFPTRQRRKHRPFTGDSEWGRLMRARRTVLIAENTPAPSP